MHDDERAMVNAGARRSGAGRWRPVAARWGRRLAAVATLVLGTWLLAWLALPPLVERGLQRVGDRQLGRALTVGRVEVAPWRLALTLHDLALAGAEGTPPQLRIRRLYVDASWQSLWRLAPVLDAVQVDGPALRLTHLGEGRYDVDDILQRLGTGGADEAPSPGLPRFAIYNIELRDGDIEWHDVPHARTHRVSALRLDVPFIANLDAWRTVKVRPRLAFQLDGGTFDSQAEATPFADDHRADAQLRLEDLDLATYAPYLPAGLPLVLQGGRLDVDLRLSFVQRPAVRLQVQGDVAVRQLALTDRRGDEVLVLQALRVRLRELAPLEASVHVEAVTLDAPRVALRRDARGAWNVAALWQAPPRDTARPSATAKADVGWRARVERLAIRDGALDWDDRQVAGGARTRVEALALEADGLQWPLAGEASVRGQARVWAPAGGAASAPATVAFDGRIEGADTVRAKVALQGAELGGWPAYWPASWRVRPSGRLDVEAEVGWNAAQGMWVRVAELQLRDAALACVAVADCGDVRGLVPLPARTALAIGTVRVNDAELALASRRLHVGSVALDRVRALVDRDDQGRWMVERWGIAPAGEAAAPVARDASPGWNVRLGSLTVRRSALGYRDAAAPSAVAFSASDVSLELGEIAPMAATSPRATRFRLGARVGAARADPGRLLAGGSLTLRPLAVRARLSASRLPLHALAPYVAPALNADIRRADAGFKGQVTLRQTAAGLDMHVGGDAMVDDFRARTVHAAEAGGAPRPAVAGEPLLNWKSLALQGIDVRLPAGQAPAIEVRRVALTDFFARIVVQEDGRLNLQDLVKATEVGGEEAAGPPPRVRIGPVELSNGTVAFADRFIRPNYSADITELQGQLGAFSSEAPEGQVQPPLAEIALSGRVQGTATLDLRGQLNPLASPLALDITGHVQGLELPALSPYAIRYAGHGIERGKLSMDVHYQVAPDGQLAASNRLVLNQLAFGDPVDGAPASLPVRLAVALLADRDGVIDVDLPIRGSLNDPQFSLGGVILRAITNLILKAVTAPFSLLAGALGGEAVDAGQVVFRPGTASLDEAARVVLDKVAQALAERPRVRLTVVGHADPAREQSAWKRERLQQLVQAEKRRQAVRAGQDPSQVGPVTVEEYPELLRQVYRRADIRKPRNLIGLAKDIPLEQMEALLMDDIAVPDDAMDALAVARAVAVRDHLAQRGVALERLFLGAVKVGATPATGTDPWVPHVRLEPGL
jgi:hypothetical protein